MQTKKVERKNALLIAATELFSSKGFHDVKLEEVASMAGVGKGTIYTYFRSKDELLVQCLLHGIPEYEEQVDAILAKSHDFSTTFRELIKFRYSISEIKGPLIRQFMMLGPQLKLSDQEYRSLISAFERNNERMSGFFSKALKEKVLKSSLTPGQMAIMFQQIFDLNVIFTFYKEPTMQEEEIFNFLIQAFGQTRRS
ncbi:MAG: TetR/AcrR family transcriptional regulator [Candidatus Riflebacteria bacterium]